MGREVGGWIARGWDGRGWRVQGRAPHATVPGGPRWRRKLPCRHADCGCWKRSMRRGAARHAAVMPGGGPLTVAQEVDEGEAEEDGGAGGAGAGRALAKVLHRKRGARMRERVFSAWGWGAACGGHTKARSEGVVAAVKRARTRRGLGGPRGRALGQAQAVPGGRCAAAAARLEERIQHGVGECSVVHSIKGQLLVVPECNALARDEGTVGQVGDVAAAPRRRPRRRRRGRVGGRRRGRVGGWRLGRGRRGRRGGLGGGRRGRRRRGRRRHGGRLGRRRRWRGGWRGGQRWWGGWRGWSWWRRALIGTVAAGRAGGGVGRRRGAGASDPQPAPIGTACRRRLHSAAEHRKSTAAWAPQRHKRSGRPPAAPHRRQRSTSSSTSSSTNTIAATTTAAAPSPPPPAQQHHPNCLTAGGGAALTTRAWMPRRC